MPPVHKKKSARDRLAQHLDERRLDLGMKWADVAANSGLTTETLRQVRSGSSAIRPLTARAIELALGWTRGSVQAVLQGGEPTLDPGGPSTVAVAHIQPMSEGGTNDDSNLVAITADENRKVSAPDDDVDDDPVLFLLTQEERERLRRRPKAEQRRVLESMRASARAVADAVLATGDEE